MVEKSKKKEQRVFILLICISLACILLDKFDKLDFLHRIFEKISNPIQRIIYQHRLQSKKSSLDDYIWQEKAEMLERENARLRLETEKLHSENEDMKRLLQAPLPAEWQFIPADIIGIKENVLTIEKGSDDGVGQGQITVWENILIGRIEEVKPRLSKISIPGHKDLKISAYILENDGKGIITSGQGGRIILDQVLQEVNLAAGQIIAASGEDETFPKGLLIGTIEEVLMEETAVYQQAIIKPLVDYEMLENIFIIQ